MKLALVVPGGFDRGERIIPVLQNLAGELASRHEVWVFAEEGPSGPGRYLRAGAQVHQLGGSGAFAANPEPPDVFSRGLGFARFARQLFGSVAEAQSSGPFHLVHALWAGHTGLVAALLARRSRLPIVVSIGGGEAVWLPDIGYGGAGSVFGRTRARATLRMAHAITAGSAFAAQQLPGRAKMSAQIVPLGIRCETFAAPPARPVGPPWRLLQVADLSAVKDQEMLLRAFARVVARLGDVSLDCIGEDTLHGRLRKRADDLGVGGRVVFHGFQPQKQLPAFYRNAHLHVLSSRYESQGVAILEAAAAGVPTVGTGVGLVPTLANLDPPAARAVPPTDFAALADAICALLVDDPGRQAMGQAAQRWASDHDAGWTARAFEQVYDRITGSASSDREAG